MKKLIAILLMLVMTLCASGAMAASADDLMFFGFEGDQTAYLSLCNRTAAGALEIPKTRTIEGLECRVTHITAYAFDGCTALTSVTIPEGVTDIGTYAFNSCEALTSVTFTGTTPPTFGEHVFFGCTALETIYVPEGSEEDYKNALEGQYTISIDGNKVFCAPMVEALPKPADLPKTGDASMLGAWACLLAIVGVGLMMMRRREA